MTSRARWRFLVSAASKAKSLFQLIAQKSAVSGVVGLSRYMEQQDATLTWKKAKEETTKKKKKGTKKGKKKRRISSSSEEEVVVVHRVSVQWSLYRTKLFNSLSLSLTWLIPRTYTIATMFC